jgi:hypothetical protein
MNIQDAIKQAGEGGKIRRKQWAGEVPSFIIPSDERKEIFLEKEWFGKNRLQVRDILATNWEVVAPDIEVGDVVDSCDTDPCECIVTGLSSSGGMTFKGTYKDGQTCVCYDDNPKRFILKDGRVAPMATSGKHFQYANGLSKGPAYDFVGNGKTYTMTLTEESNKEDK